MSQKNNVNPDHYKVAGRDRPNEIVSPRTKQAYSEDRARLDKKVDSRIPNQERTGTKPENED